MSAGPSAPTPSMLRLASWRLCCSTAPVRALIDLSCAHCPFTWSVAGRCCEKTIFFPRHPKFFASKAYLSALKLPWKFFCRPTSHPFLDYKRKYRQSREQKCYINVKRTTFRKTVIGDSAPGFYRYVEVTQIETSIFCCFRCATLSPITVHFKRFYTFIFAVFVHFNHNN